MNRRPLLALLLLVIALSTHRAAQADGGRLRFSKTAGPFLITLFTTPEPLTPGPADFSVMIQDAETGKILPDAVVTMDWSSAGRETIRARTRQNVATNKLLTAAEIVLPAAADWHLQMHVEEASRSAACETDIRVEPGSRTALLVWIFALIPFVCVGLFLLHQRQKLLLNRGTATIG